MRIIGYIEHPVLKITVFKMNNKISVKLESGLYEQTYKFRSGDQIQSVEDIKAVVDAELLTQVQQGLQQMHQHKLEAIGRNIEESEEEFEEII